MKPSQSLSSLLLALLCSLITAQAASVRVANQGDVLSLDPHSLNEAVQLSFLNNVFESLVTRGKDLKLVPSLAVAWRLKSPTVWQFDLRKDVVFHDGAPFSADDVVYSLDRARAKAPMCVLNWELSRRCARRAICRLRSTPPYPTRSCRT